MTKEPTIKTKIDKRENPVTPDDAELEEFFMQVASIARRLTREDIRHNNGNNHSCREVDSP